MGDLVLCEADLSAAGVSDGRSGVEHSEHPHHGQDDRQQKSLGLRGLDYTCKRTEREARKAAGQFPGQVEVVKLDALGPEAEAYGLLFTPMVVVGEEVAGSGKVVPAQKLVPIIQAQLGG